QSVEVLKSKDFQKVPILVGITNHEFGWIRQTPGVNEIIAEEYLKNAKTPEDIRDAFTEMLGDLFMVIPSITVALYHRDAGVPVYMYEFQHLTVMGYWANFIRTESPNGPSLVHWPVYDKTNKYMNLGLQQTEGQDLKMDKLLFFTEELPKKLAALHKA
uniref:Carboxylesterase type B domain-containing protein n=1 Tax=Sinocyclocheilus rhinocerous TaxID=307959 RepID=A0A673MC03_9TELE